MITKDNYRELLENNKISKYDIPLELFDEHNLSDLRELGFPYLEFNKNKYLQIFQKLRDFDVDSLIKDNNYIKPYTHFSKLASVFFPEMYETPVWGKNTPMSAWLSDKYLLRTLWLCKKNFKNPKYSNLRTVLQIVSGVQCVSNFRPEVAKFIYQTFSPKNGRVYDFSAGYGGRLVGALASHIQEYISVDVNINNFKHYKEITDQYNSDKRINIVYNGSESYCPIEYKNYFDLAFSSPPYFIKEQYSSDNAQSYKKYPNYDDWISGFLRPTIQNCVYMIKPDGYFIINIANIKLGTKSFALEDITLDIARDLNLSLEKVYFYQLSKMIGIKKLVSKDEDFKREPIFIFRKV